MNFYKWLETQQNRNDEIGDIAHDISRDIHKPQKPFIGILRTYIKNKSCNNANVLEALENAWKEYRNS